MHNVELELERVDITVNNHVIEFDGLSTQEQDMVMTAIEDGTYTRCVKDGPIPDSINQFEYRVESKRNDENNNAYLKRDSQLYMIFYKVEDQVHATIPAEEPTAAPTTTT
jgi:hypothetical protein